MYGQTTETSFWVEMDSYLYEYNVRKFMEINNSETISGGVSSITCELYFMTISFLNS